MALLLLVMMAGLSSGFQVRDIEDVIVQKARRPPPSTRHGHPLDVKLGLYFESLGNFRSSEMSFDVDLYMYMSWRDSRLNHTFHDYVLVNDDVVRKEIWLPDLYIANAREAKFHHVTIPNFSIFIANDGTISYSLRVTLTVACNLNLKNYPMDTQNCFIRILSYAHVANQVNITWFSSHPIRHNSEIGLPEFRIMKVYEDYCNGNYRYAVTERSYKQDNFSCLTGHILLSRSIGYNLVQSYIPTGLIVCISWVSFWIDRRAVPARVTLSFTTLVSLTTLGNGLRFGLPQVSYAKAIDLWYGACMLFVFCALLEFAIVNSYMRKSEKYDGLSKRFILNKSCDVYDENDDDDDDKTGAPTTTETRLFTTTATTMTMDDTSAAFGGSGATSFRNSLLFADETPPHLTPNGSISGRRRDTPRRLLPPPSPGSTFTSPTTHRSIMGGPPPPPPPVPGPHPSASLASSTSGSRRPSLRNLLFGRLSGRSVSERGCVKFVENDYQLVVINDGSESTISRYDNVPPPTSHNSPLVPPPLLTQRTVETGLSFAANSPTAAAAVSTSSSSETEDDDEQSRRPLRPLSRTSSRQQNHTTIGGFFPSLNGTNGGGRPVIAVATSPRRVSITAGSTFSKRHRTRPVNGNRKTTETPRPDSNGYDTSEPKKDTYNPLAHFANLSRRYSRMALNIDKVCRYAFPLTFLFWNLLYWWYYMVYQATTPFQHL